MFDKGNSAYRHKNGADVRVRLMGEDPFNAVAYLSIGQRLTDLLNDDRAFIPMRRENGDMLIIAKSQIASIAEIEATVDAEDETDTALPATSARPKRAAGRKGFDAYAVLRVSPDAPLETVRAAYKTRIKAVHPDSVAALDLDDDLAKAALLAAQKVNFAYRKIMRERGASVTEDGDAA